MALEYGGLVDQIIDLALLEDIGSGDAATEALVPRHSQTRARLVAKGDGVVSGQWVAARVFARLDAGVRYAAVCPDGGCVRVGDLVAEVEGSYAALLEGERTALNFLQRLSGIATITSRYVAAIGDLPTRLLDTRKTAPGQRVLEKRAVADGGGVNHRMGLYDMAMIKDNHIAVAGGIRAAVEGVRRRIPAYMKIEVETSTLAEVDEALACGVEIIMLDNMDLAMMRDAVRRIAGKALVEASGNVTLERVRAIAETGVDFISSGAITHSAPVLDISMRMAPAPAE